MNVRKHLLLTVAQAARRLGLTPAQVRRMVRGPQLVGVKINGRIYLSADQVA